MNNSKLQIPSKVIFIAGFPRSGTTWLGNLFNSHPNVIYRHEPLGRLHQQIDRKLFLALKFNNGLSEPNQQQLLRFLTLAHPESDRPPFFHKSHDWIPLPLRTFFWMSASRLRVFNPLYKKLASPRIHPETLLVIKETGWSTQLQSIIEGLQPEMTIFLFRHPCAVVASFLRGIRLNLMKQPTKEIKIDWFRKHIEARYISEAGIDEKPLQQMDDIEFFAFQWRTFVEICLECQESTHKRTSIVVYEDLQRDTQAIIISLFSEANLSFGEYTKYFLQKSTSVSFTKLGLLERDGRNAYYSVYRDPNHDIYKWKKELSEDMITRIGRIAGEHILKKFWGEIIED